MNRRDFVKATGALAAIPAVGMSKDSSEKPHFITTDLVKGSVEPACKIKKNRTVGFDDHGNVVDENMNTIIERDATFDYLCKFYCDGEPLPDVDVAILKAFLDEGKLDVICVGQEEIRKTHDALKPYMPGKTIMKVLHDKHDIHMLRYTLKGPITYEVVKVADVKA
jgi:hypothetical protein